VSVTACVYVTDGWGIHDERWTQALVTLGFTPRSIRLGIDATDPADLTRLVAQHAHKDTPVLAGPLTTVTQHLIDIPARVIGLSWGFDLHDLQDTSWLAALDGLIVDSPATRDIAIAADVDSARITYLPWGVDLEAFQDSGPKVDLRTFGVPVGARTVLSLRAHEPRYRVADIIDAFADANISNTHLLLGHAGTLTAELHEHAQARGIGESTHFLGSIPEENLPTILRAVDLYVSASSVDGTSVTLLQAMACGTPVVVSDTPGNQDWVENGSTGFLFRTADHQHLAVQLRQALETPRGTLRALTQRARARVERDADWRANLPRLAQAIQPR
jgi:glycosyltransferase involved in cell wall biosynthesis